MQRRTSTAPVHVFTYGCSYRGVTLNADRADQQYRLAHAYHAKLIDFELARRTAVRAALAAAPDVSRLTEEHTRIQIELETALQAVRDHKRVARTSRVPESLSSAVRTLKVTAKTTREALKAAKQFSAKDPTIKAALAQTETVYRDAIRKARGESQLYWGTYLIIEKAAEQQRNEIRDPHHRPYTGEGRIAVQLQGGLKTPNLATDTRFQLVPLVPLAHSKNGKPLPQPKDASKRQLCRIRVDSTETGKPVWAEIETLVHRPIPEDARITWAWLHRIRRGLKWVYTVQLTIESRTFAAIATGKRRVAVDLGWRVAQKGAGGLRVAYWRDDAGAHGELRLPATMLSALDYPSQLLGVEENWFEKARTLLVEWLAANSAPDEHIERTRNLAQWHSGIRLAGYVWWWREHRFDGDQAVYAAMEEWRVRRFWHYRNWSMAQRDKALASRKDSYWCFAKKLLDGCCELVLEDLDLRKFAKKIDGVPALRYWRVQGAPSELRMCLESSAARSGVTVTKVDPAMTTRRCNACGSEAPWDQVPNIDHTCAACGATWDQDDNACINMLRTSSAVVGEVPGALAGGELLEIEEKKQED